MTIQQKKTAVGVTALYGGFMVMGTLFFMFFQAGLDVALFL